MAGSRRWFTYVTDGGTSYAINLDESNTELANGAAANVSVLGLVASVPKNVTPRYVLFKDASGNYSRRVVGLTVASFNALTAASTLTFPVEGAAGVDMAPSFKRGESIRIPATVDTGLLDGDQP